MLVLFFKSVNYSGKFWQPPLCIVLYIYRKMLIKLCQEWTAGLRFGVHGKELWTTPTWNLARRAVQLGEMAIMMLTYRTDGTEWNAWPFDFSDFCSLYPFPRSFILSLSLSIFSPYQLWSKLDSHSRVSFTMLISAFGNVCLSVSCFTMPKHVILAT